MTGYVAAVALLLNVSYLELLILVFPAWVATVSVVILAAGRSQTPSGPAAESSGG